MIMERSVSTMANVRINRLKLLVPASVLVRYAQNVEFHSTFSRLGNQKTPFHCPRLNENVLYTPYLSVCFKYLLPIRL